ncbi:MAG: helix-turn-helix transcriptional regulator [Alistipes sp.]
MKEKLLELLKSEGLKSSQLAEMLEINPAGISHILAGRNKPGFDLLQKILRRFPRINPDWLLLDASNMYREEYGGTAQPGNSPSASGASSRSALLAADLFGAGSASSPHSGAAQTSSAEISKFGIAADAASQSSANSGSANSSPLRTSGTATRVVIFYDDQTFECFTPNK